MCICSHTFSYVDYKCLGIRSSGCILGLKFVDQSQNSSDLVAKMKNTELNL
ncbi:hypothetical protein HanOQP8_Chr08g0280771 [Helianthus annuus]|uniref:Uncharacterized protein n=1 Tax=Helianthus annuus TaxID=4232 RepID=A0A251U4U2_HELAN|nr:hypothetical protein HanIR_Chr08g0358631 [Helianthus annuus]KAJ0721914.1 hypothetical protein HanOQP8_Chr08g0280771 [Helianthus annuus]